MPAWLRCKLAGLQSRGQRRKWPPQLLHPPGSKFELRPQCRADRILAGGLAGRAPPVRRPQFRASLRSGGIDHRTERRRENHAIAHAGGPQRALRGRRDVGRGAGAAAGGRAPRGHCLSGASGRADEEPDRGRESGILSGAVGRRGRRRAAAGRTGPDRIRGPRGSLSVGRPMSTRRPGLPAAQTSGPVVAR